MLPHLEYKINATPVASERHEASLASNSLSRTPGQTAVIANMKRLKPCLARNTNEYQGLGHL